MRPRSAGHLHVMHLDRDRLKLGAMFSLEHASQLIRDAAHLYTQGSYPTAFVLTVFAREELGRANLLWARCSTTAQSQTVASEELKAQLEDHHARLEAGQSTTHVQLTQKEIELLRSCADPATLTAAYSEIRKRLKRVRKHDPGNFHQRRLKAQYVDINQDGTWSRPSKETTKKDAQHLGLTVSSEVLGALLQLQESDDFQVASLDSTVQLPNWGDLQQILLTAFCETNA